MFFSSFFFFNDTATTEIYTLSLHDALPIWVVTSVQMTPSASTNCASTHPSPKVLSKWWNRHFGLRLHGHVAPPSDRKSTRLNSSHVEISYAVFCLKKKKN